MRSMTYLAQEQELVHMSVLLQAIRKRKSGLVEQLLNQGESPNQVDPNTGESALCLSVRLGNRDCVKLLLEYGADPNQADTAESPLIDAAAFGFAEIVELLLDMGAHIDATDEDGTTALIAAASNGHTQVVRALVESGADIGKKDNCGTAGITHAAVGLHTEIVEALAPHVAPNDRPALGSASRQDSGPAPGGDDFRLMDAVDRGDVDAVRTCVAAGANVNASFTEGITVACIAAARGYVEALEALVVLGANVNHQTDDGDCPLDFAAKAGQSQTYDLLLPLTRKSQRANAEWLKESKLLRFEWFLPRPDIDSQFRVQDVEREVLREAFFCAKSASFPEAEERLLEYLEQSRVPPSAILSDGTTLLICASQSGNLNVVKTLAEKYSVDPNRTTKGGLFALAAADRECVRDRTKHQPVYEYLFPLTSAKLREQIDENNKITNQRR